MEGGGVAPPTRQPCGFERIVAGGDAGATLIVRVFLVLERRRLPAHDGGRRLREPRKLRPRKCWWRGRLRVRDCVPPAEHLALAESLAPLRSSSPQEYKSFVAHAVDDVIHFQDGLG